AGALGGLLGEQRRIEVLGRELRRDAERVSARARLWREVCFEPGLDRRAARRDRRLARLLPTCLGRAIAPAAAPAAGARSRRTSAGLGGRRLLGLTARGGTLAALGHTLRCYQSPPRRAAKRAVVVFDG